MSEDPLTDYHQTTSEIPGTIARVKTKRDRSRIMNFHKRSLVLSSVLASRVVYTVNWFSISPALQTISIELGIGPTSIGLLTSSFLIGAGIFQIPAGLLASRWGSKNTSQLGMLVLSLSAIGEGISPNYAVLFATRFILGIGAALFFAPAIGVLTPLFKPEEEGFVMGLYSAMFNVGGGLGLFAWAFLVDTWTWRPALVFGGVLGLVLVAIGQVVIPKDKVVAMPRGSMKVAFKSRNIMLISLGIIGMWGGVFTTSQLLPKFLSDVHHISTAEAGLITSLIMFAAILGGPIGGRASDLLRRRKVFMLLPGLGVALGLSLIGIVRPYQLWFLIPVIGFMDSIVFSIEYASASQYPEVGHQYASLAISLMNAVQILGSVGIPTAFGIIGYSLGWYFLGLATVSGLVLVLWIQEPFKAGARISI